MGKPVVRVDGNGRTKFERIHRLGAERHPQSWFTANTKAAAILLGSSIPLTYESKTLVSEVVLRTLDIVEAP